MTLNWTVSEILSGKDDIDRLKNLPLQSLEEGLFLIIPF